MDEVSRCFFVSALVSECSSHLLFKTINFPNLKLTEQNTISEAVLKDFKSVHTSGYAAIYGCSLAFPGDELVSYTIILFGL